jgi:hypothetical protein
MTAKRGGDFRQGAMTSAASDQTIASDYLIRAEKILAVRQGCTVEENRPAIARALDVSVTSVERIRHKRRKVIAAWLKDKIVNLFIEAAQAELRSLTHDIEIARQIGLGNGDGALIEARARAQALVKILDDISSEGGQQAAE